MTTELCIYCEFAYIDDNEYIYCDCIEDEDYGNCPFAEEDFEEF